MASFPPNYPKSLDNKCQYSASKTPSNNKLQVAYLLIVIIYYCYSEFSTH